ncbi:NUDIX hydrolase [Kitasatospora sp. NPDC049285]|uniref:NUDIX hydrolase n=1 Tax=Kitasatospora sp. NPDC049285 TaxID=3157096 RepID=UPI00343CD0CE
MTEMTQRETAQPLTTHRTAAETADLAARFPALHAPQRWEWGGIDAQFSVQLPADELITNIHLVGFVEGRVVLCRDTRGHWFLPGGTREAEESVESCLERELREEAGASLAGPPTWIGAHRAVADGPVPYRPWQPHPVKAWLWGWAEVVLDSAPTNPADGEQVVEVRPVTPAEAQHLLTHHREPWWAELVALAVESHSAT